jgi:hypothetical protein
MSSLPTFPRFTQQSPEYKRLMRKATCEVMAGMVWGQYCLENDIDPKQSAEVVMGDFVASCEAIVNALLSPDLKDAALLAVADVIVRDNSCGSVTISEASRATQVSYLKTAESAVQALLLNLLTDAPDPYYRDSMCRLVDAIAPKKGIN